MGLERMRRELVAEGRDVLFAAVNVATADTFQEELVSRSYFALFQDLAEVDVGRRHHAHIDDILIYDRDGLLSSYLPVGGAVSITLSSESGYRNVKGAVLRAHGAP